jgi:hypothetical protein
MAKFENSVTHCLTECQHCTGAYTDDRDLILLNCICSCHKNNCNIDCKDINKKVTPKILAENSGYSQTKDDV